MGETPVEWFFDKCMGETPVTWYQVLGVKDKALVTGVGETSAGW